jgi:hypothetical protein
MLIPILPNIGGVVVGHVDKCCGVSLGVGGGLCGWEEVTLRVWEFITVVLVGLANSGGVRGVGVEWSSCGGRDGRGVGVGPDGRPVMSCRKPWVGGCGGLVE